MNNKYLEELFSSMKSEGREPYNLFGIQSDPGWNHLLFILYKLIKLYDKNNYIKITQIKSKFGGLRFYINYNGPMYKNSLKNKIKDFIIKFDIFRIIPCSYKYNKELDETYSKISDIISDFETISLTICENCGIEGKQYNPNYWIYTLCDKCIEDMKIEKEQTDTKNEELLCSGHLQPMDI